jgi:hypothetical protein
MRDVLQFGTYSGFEIIYRTALLYANLRETVCGHLSRSDAYDGLDPSEKGAVSYFLGLSASKLFAGRCLQVPWLLHLDVYRTQLNAVLKKGRSKPDLVGQDCSGNWIIIESKGRTNDFDEKALARAKKQSRRVRTISGSPPKFRLGVQSYFEEGHLRLAVVDPDHDGGAIDLPISPQMVNHEYYDPFRAWIEAGDSYRVAIEDRVFWVRREPSLDLTVGLEQARYKRVGKNETDIDQISGNPADHFVGSDGVLVELGPAWSNKVMALQPEERRR